MSLSFRVFCQVKLIFLQFNPFSFFLAVQFRLSFPPDIKLGFSNGNLFSDWTLLPLKTNGVHTLPSSKGSTSKFQCPGSEGHWRNFLTLVSSSFEIFALMSPS